MRSDILRKPAKADGTFWSSGGPSYGGDCVNALAVVGALFISLTAGTAAGHGVGQAYLSRRNQPLPEFALLAFILGVAVACLVKLARLL